MRSTKRLSFPLGILHASLLLVISWTFASTAPAFAQDQPPVLNLAEPVSYAIGHPDIRIRGECVDDGPSCTLAVEGTGLPKLELVGKAFDTVIRPRDGQRTLLFTLTDSTGHTVKVTRQIFVYSGGGLPVTDTFQGAILAMDDAGRALTYDRSVTPSVVRLYDRTAHTSQIIWTAADAVENVMSGFLTVGNGALITVETSSGDRPLLEWRGGALTQVGSVLGLPVSNGAWAAYYRRTAPHVLILRDLTARTNTQVTATPALGQLALGPDGRLLFMVPTYELLEFNPNPPPGTTTVLAPPMPPMDYQALTDGINLVFLRYSNDPIQKVSIVLRTQAGAEEVLATDHVLADRDTYYQVAGGWTAFVRRDYSVWLRRPDGTLRQVAARGYIEALHENGDLVFANSVTVDAVDAADDYRITTRYLAKAEGTVRELGPIFGTVKFINGAPVIIAGNQLVEIAPQPSHAILAEGATGTFFSTDVAILNPAAAPVPVMVRYFREGQPEISLPRTLPARSRTTIRLDDVPGLEGASVSTQIDGPPGAPLVVERLMSWDATGYGGHLGSAVDASRRQWYFAEGAQGFFSTFFLVANSGAKEATVEFEFLLEGETAPVRHTMKVPPAARRTLFAGDVPGLVNHSFATVVETDVPVVTERAMYFGDSPLWLGGHGSAGISAPAFDWFHAEGATGSLFDTFILLANPNGFDAPVTVTFITDSGVTVTRQKTVKALSRTTINIENEAPELASANVSTRVQSNFYPIVAERAMYWGTTGSGWREAHNSFGVTGSGLKWGLAEGRAGGARGYQTFVLVSNATADDAELEVTFIREDGLTFERSYRAPAGARANIPASDLAELANSNFATIVESINGVPINVESAIYWNVGGVIWEAGGNTVATPIP